MGLGAALGQAASLTSLPEKYLALFAIVPLWELNARCAFASEFRVSVLAMAAALQERLQTASAEFQKIQNDLSVAVDARQKLDAQLSENELVKKVRRFSLILLFSGPSIHVAVHVGMAHTALQEFASLTADNTVYKLVGPVLVKQDQTEAKQNVDTRLDFIRGEMYAFPHRNLFICIVLITVWLW